MPIRNRATNRLMEEYLSELDGETYLNLTQFVKGEKLNVAVVLRILSEMCKKD